MSDSAKTPHRWADKLAKRREAYKSRGRVYRVLFVLSGAIITLAGIALLVLPGPALVVIPIGLTMLAMEFAWAERALEKVLLQAEKASESAKEASRGHKMLAGLTIVVSVGALVAWGIVGNIPVVPDP